MKLGILGGMGPMATADFFKKVIEMTDATNDQEHIHVLIDNNTEIPDRTGYILNKGDDPKREMVRTAIKLEMMGADMIAMPCNTAHYFYNEINSFTDIPVINMIEETAKYLCTQVPESKEFLLLATTGTYESKVYQQIFESFGLKVIEPDDDGKEDVMRWIYEVKAGEISVKADAIDALISSKTDGKDIPVILGCTELPVLAQTLKLQGVFIDPTKVLAETCVAQVSTAGKHKN